MKKLAKLLSVFLHPLFIPTFGVGMLLLFNSIFKPNHPAVAIFIIGFVILNTVVIPSIGMLVIWLINDRKLNLHNKDERLSPYIITLFSYLVLVYVFFNIAAVDDIYGVILFAASVVIFLLLVISLFWKISAHMAGYGGLLACFFILSKYFYVDVFSLAAILVLLAGLLACARLLLKRHTLAQVVAGFALGVTVYSVVFVMLGYCTVG